MTSGKPAIAATSPKAQWPSSTPSARLSPSPNSHQATNTEDHLEVHHPAGRSPRCRPKGGLDALTDELGTIPEGAGTTRRKCPLTPTDGLRHRALERRLADARTCLSVSP